MHGHSYAFGVSWHCVFEGQRCVPRAHSSTALRSANRRIGNSVGEQVLLGALCGEAHTYWKSNMAKPIHIIIQPYWYLHQYLYTIQMCVCWFVGLSLKGPNLHYSTLYMWQVHNYIAQTEQTIHPHHRIFFSDDLCVVLHAYCRDAYANYINGDQGVVNGYFTAP